MRFEVNRQTRKKEVGVIRPWRRAWRRRPQGAARGHFARLWRRIDEIAEIEVGAAEPLGQPPRDEADRSQRRSPAQLAERRLARRDCAPYARSRQAGSRRNTARARSIRRARPRLRRAPACGQAGRAPPGSFRADRRQGRGLHRPAGRPRAARHRPWWRSAPPRSSAPGP